MCAASQCSALTIVALGPRETAAEPLLIVVPGAPGVPGAACGALVGDTTQNCGLFSLGEPSANQTLAGSFQADNDVALFQFILTGAAGVSAFTSGDATALDSLIGLFYGPGSIDPIGGLDRTGDIVRYFNVVEDGVVNARNDDISGTNLNSALPVILLDPGTYILALLQTGNDFTSGLSAIDSLLAPFSHDDDPNYNGGICAAGGCNFALSLTVDSGETPASIPEPGTLTLVALGSAAAVARRFRRRERQH